MCAHAHVTHILYRARAHGEYHYSNLPNNMRCAIFTKLFLHVAYHCGSVLLRRGDEIPRKRRNFGVSNPTDNALYNIAFETRQTKTAEPIETPFVGPIIGRPTPSGNRIIASPCMPYTS